MTFPFDTSEKDIFDFEQLLREHGLTIQKDSDLEKILLAVLEVNAKYKKELAHDNSTDIRQLFSDVAGIIDLVKQVLKHREHPDFKQIIPHLHLLNKASTATLTSKSQIRDDSNNKLMELYIALLCMSFATDIRLDDPNNSKGDNPDVMFYFRNQTWAIACKALHSSKEKTLYDTIKKGTDQINKSNASKGIVVVNYKNIIDRDKMWPIVNQEQFNNNNAEPEFYGFSDFNEPLDILYSYGYESREKLVNEIGIEHLIKLSDSKKCFPGFLVFLQAITGVRQNDQNYPTLLKTFNLVQFENPTEEYLGYFELTIKLNNAMHNQI